MFKTSSPVWDRVAQRPPVVPPKAAARTDLLEGWRPVSSRVQLPTPCQSTLPLCSQLLAIAAAILGICLSLLYEEVQPLVSQGVVP